MKWRWIAVVEDMGIDQVKFFKGCLPQVLLGPFSNILSYIRVYIKLFCHLLLFEKRKLQSFEMSWIWIIYMNNLSYIEISV